MSDPRLEAVAKALYNLNPDQSDYCDYDGFHDYIAWCDAPEASKDDSRRMAAAAFGTDTDTGKEQGEIYGGLPVRVDPTLPPGTFALEQKGGERAIFKIDGETVQRVDVPDYHKLP